jgi:hypothetical protein
LAAVEPSRRLLTVGKNQTTEQPPQKYYKHCPRCGNKLRTIVVHGHEQCLECDQVIYDCCQGEQCNP